MPEYKHGMQQQQQQQPGPVAGSDVPWLLSSHCNDSIIPLHALTQAVVHWNIHSWHQLDTHIGTQAVAEPR